MQSYYPGCKKSEILSYCRAKNVSGLKRDLSNAKLNKPRNLTCAKGGTHGAANENWPVKHLRVNVVPPMKDADVSLQNDLQSNGQ